MRVGQRSGVRVDEGRFCGLAHFASKIPEPNLEKPTAPQAVFIPVVSETLTRLSLCGFAIVVVELG